MPNIHYGRTVNALGQIQYKLDVKAHLLNQLKLGIKQCTYDYIYIDKNLP